MIQYNVLSCNYGYNLYFYDNIHQMTMGKQFDNVKRVTGRVEPTKNYHLNLQLQLFSEFQLIV